MIFDLYPNIKSFHEECFLNVRGNPVIFGYLCGMKRVTLFILAAMLSLSAVHSQDLRVASYNIRYASSADYNHGDGWNQRKDVLCSFLGYEDFDVFGAQEVTWPQLQDMLSALSQYGYVGVGRDDGDRGGEFCPVFYNKERFELLDSGTFWLSETPDKPAKGWDAACVRICTWAHLLDSQSKKDVWFFNTHLDHIGVVAREEGAKLILSKIRSIAGEGVKAVVTGDFNVDQSNPVYSTVISDGLLKDCAVCADKKFIPSGTISDWKVGNYTESHIDHIFVSSGNADVRKFAVLTFHYWNSETIEQSKLGDFPSEVQSVKRSVHTTSDHYPIAAEISFENK